MIEMGLHVAVWRHYLLVTVSLVTHVVAMATRVMWGRVGVGADVGRGPLFSHLKNTRFNLKV